MYQRGEKLNIPKTHKTIRNQFILKKKQKEIKEEGMRNIWAL